MSVPPVQIKIDIDEATAQGTYANLALLSHTETEFVLDFIYANPQVPKAKVRARILSSPIHTKRLLTALQENVKRYEGQFGVIKVSGDPDKPAAYQGQYL